MKTYGLAGAPNFGTSNAEFDTITIGRSTVSTVTTPITETMDRLDGYLDNMALKETGEKAFLKKLVDNNKTLVSTNASLISTTKILENDVRVLK